MDQTWTNDAYQVTRPEIAVFISGITSMGLEILAGRMVAPQFGSSIYTWGSIIGVFLAALSYGYYRGGKLASDRATTDHIARVFLLTAVYVAGIIILGDLMLRATAGFPLPSRFASLPAIILLFGPPTYFLGFISPYAAELSLKDGIGKASGHVYALGTIGSIIGAFGTTFVLIPSFSVNQIAFMFGALAVVCAIWMVFPKRDWEELLSFGFVLILLIGAVASGAAGVTVEGRVVYETQTPYQELRVVDTGDTRTLFLGGQRHSAMDVTDPDRHVYSYTRYFHLPLLFTEDVDRVLFIGGGGFTGPKRFAEDYNVTVDVVEIDPTVIETAKTYFNVTESESLRIHQGDGRAFLRETNQEYDVIILDAYRKDKVPFHLTTVEFMELASDRLSRDGVLFANVISAPTGPASEFYRSEYKTMNQVFPQVYGFPTSGGAVVQNIEVVATKNEARLGESELLQRNDRRDIGIDLSAEIRTYAEPPDTTNAPILRDDHAPVDELLDAMIGQRYVIQETNQSVPRAGS